MWQAEIVTLDGELGVLLPDAVLERLQWQDGRNIFMTQNAEGYLLTCAPPSAAVPAALPEPVRRA